jgi:hypothetical protein
MFSSLLTETRYSWQRIYEAFCVCRHCQKSVVFILAEKTNRNSVPLGQVTESVNLYYNVEDYVSLKDYNSIRPPEHLPPLIQSAFVEGAVCVSVNCYNAGATMFRLCIDHATKALLPSPAPGSSDPPGLNDRVRRTLGLRLKWLFDNNFLPTTLRPLSISIKEDGNDGAHDGTLTKSDADDLLDFTILLLERLYTEPERLRLAEERRNQRRKPVT